MPAPSIRWEKNGDFLWKSGNGANKTFWMESASKEDSGIYTCTVRNWLGSDNVTYFVKVRGVPGEPIIRIVGSTNQSMTLRLQLPALNVGCQDPVEGIQLRYGGEYYWDPFKMLNISANTKLYTISHLRCGQAFKVVARAYNRFGLGKQSNLIYEKETTASKPIAPTLEYLRKVDGKLTVDLGRWDDGGCPITQIQMDGKFRGHNDWVVLEANVSTGEQLYQLPSNVSQILVMTVNELGKAEKFIDLDSEAKEIANSVSRFQEGSGDVSKALKGISYALKQNGNQMQNLVASLQKLVKPM